MSRRGSVRGLRVFTPLTVLAILLGLIPLVTLTVAAPANAAPGDLLIQVVNARNAGALVANQAIPAGTHYTWLITADDAGNPKQAIAKCQNTDPDFPTGCQWPSVRQTPGAVPIVAQGDDAQLGPATALSGLPDGKYLISVLATGYTLGGAHFTIPMTAPVLKVPVQPNPVPLGSVRVRVFHDNAPVDGTYEAGSETGGQGQGNSLAGFEAHLTDVLSEVTTDWYGNPLCTNYEHQGGKVVFDAEGAPVIDAGNPGGRCLSNAQGDIVIPNIGSNRYGVTLSKPASKADWVQTTTLEGSHDWDVWVINGDTGLDSEMVVGGEPVPWVEFGYVEPRNLPATGGAHVRGQILVGLTYVGGNGGITIPGGTGTAGGKEGNPIKRPWISLSDLENGDQMVYTGRGEVDGTFDIANVPNGTYQLTYWDDNQQYIIYSFNVVVKDGNDVDTGKNYLAGWMTHLYGTVFIDTNANGKRDPGESGLPRTTVTLRERDNSLMDQFTNLVTTDTNGNYDFAQAYPLSRWLILEHFNTAFEGTGVTVQGENDPAPTTFVGAAVDINVLPVLGLGGRVDWGVRPYAPGTNGGIVGTVSYDTTRNELDPAFSAAEDYQPGVPNIPVHLYGVLKDSDPNSPTYGDPVVDSRGLEQKGPELSASYTSETWEAPKGCTARQWDGSPLTGLSFIPEPGLAANKTCIESPAMGVQMRPSDTTAGAWGQTVNGNYGFATSDRNLYLVGDPANPGYPAGYAAEHAAECAALPGNCAPDQNDLPLYAVLADYGYEPQTLVPDDYVVTVDIPDNPVGGGKMYQITREQDVNVFDGDDYLPQENFPLSTNPVYNPPVINGGNSEPPSEPPTQGNGFIPQCIGADQVVDVTNPSFLDAGGSPFQGQARPLCDEKLVTLRGQSAVAPTFTMFTQTPLPTHFWGITINDLALSWDTKSMEYGEAQGIPGVPVGLYDFSGRLVDTVLTDYNGMYEAIEPSTSSYNCPLPAGPCAGMYRFVGNDPGQPGAPNPGYNPRYRTIATNFQAWPGLFTVTDTAPTQTGAVVIAPGTATPVPVNCAVSNATPEVFAVDKVVVPATGSATARTVTVRGEGFGSFGTNSRAELVRPDGSVLNVTPPASGWTNTTVTFVVPTNVGFSLVQGPLQLRVRNSGSGLWSSSAVTVHSTRGFIYDPVIRTVGPTRTLKTIQAGIAARPVGVAETLRDALYGRIVVVEPGADSSFNPLGAYLENPVMNQRVKLQGFGPGGLYGDGTHVRGSVIDGRAFDPDGATGTAWTNLANQPHVGPAGVPDGAVVTVLPRTTAQFATTALTRTAYAGVDGFRITGGYQQDMGVNLNAVTGANHTGFGAPGATVTQGGGVYVHAYAQYLKISNNLIIGNGGSYAGGVRVGTPYATVGDNQNDNVSISYNRIRDNGGTNLAGGIGLFNGTQTYRIDHNDICGNFSSEYGGGISVYGFSPAGRIEANRVYFNQSYDEGAGIFIGGELPANPDLPSRGTGEQTVSGNEIVANNGNDDGGGLRLLQIGNYTAGERPSAAQRIGYLIRVDNNIIADNVSTHEGGGVALDDATNVQFVANTVARNITTATAMTSDGTPAPAGLSTTENSIQLQATLPAGSPTFSRPVLFDDIFWQNAAGTWDGSTVSGIGVAGASDYNYWDLGAVDGSGPLAPVNSVLTAYTPGITTSATNTLSPDNTAVAFASPYRVSVDIATLRAFPGFRQSVIVISNVPPDQLGSYHINAGSVAVNRGVVRVAYPAPIGNVDAPTVDIDGDTRWSVPPALPVLTIRSVDAGADER